MRNNIPLVLCAFACIALPGKAGADLVISEIHYTPASTNTVNWEYVEVFNRGASAVNLAGYVFDDDDGAVLAANIASGTIAPGSTGVLFNAGSNTASALSAAWGTGINWIGVANWSTLSNGGDQIGLWSSFANYDPVNFTNVLSQLTYDNVSPWPASSTGSSIYLVGPATDDETVAGNWQLSTVGTLGAYQSNPAGDNDATNIGSPGLIPEPSTLGLLALAGVFGVLRNRPSGSRRQTSTQPV